MDSRGDIRDWRFLSHFPPLRQFFSEFRRQLDAIRERYGSFHAWVKAHADREFPASATSGVAIASP
jgi:hypothetical protein